VTTTIAKPLQDVRILAIEQFGAGPYGSVHLADLGAQVIKIEDPRTGGDVGRYIEPFADGEDSLFFETFNRNKLSLSLDLVNPRGRAVFEDLVRVSDVVFSNLRGDVPEAIRISYADLSSINPAIVCCSLSAFGTTGPMRASPGYDYVLQGIGGWMSLTGEPDGPPAKSGLSMVDYSGGLVAGMAILAGLHAARRDGVGGDCDVSLFDTAISMLSYQATWHLTGGFEPARIGRSAHPSLVPFQAFPTADRWIVVACAKEKFFPRLADAIDRPDLATDRRFATFTERRANHGALQAILDDVFSTRPASEWLDRLRAAAVPCGPVNTVAEALAEPQTAARDLVVTTEHPHFGSVRQVASPVRVGTSAPTYRRAPRRNEHAHELLVDLLGYDDATVVDLTAAGAFGRQEMDT
jgi:crotonobetainyl-CoA:carnitine CoA-transferase CaiB-like acyl-CoA transferase